MVGHSRVDAALWQSKEEVKVGVYPRGEDDDIDDLFANFVSWQSHGSLRTTYTKDGTDGGGLNRGPDHTFNDVVGP